MKLLELKQMIKSPVNQVWETIIGKETYPNWTKVFGGSSEFVGEWKEGEKVYFVGSANGETAGMVSMIEKLVEGKYISIIPIGMFMGKIENAVISNENEWIGSSESYTLIQDGENTIFELKANIPDEFFYSFSDMWKRGLLRLANLCESGNIKKISITTTVNSTIESVWDAWTNPHHITKWAFASDDWESPIAKNEIKNDGKFLTRMQSKADPNIGFDFTGQYMEVQEKKYINYIIDDGRFVEIIFEEVDCGIKISQTFEAEQENSVELQRAGWQSILDNFKYYVEKNYDATK